LEFFQLTSLNFFNLLLSTLFWKQISRTKASAKKIAKHSGRKTVANKEQREAQQKGTAKKPHRFRPGTGKNLLL
jgi:hypothetical protein